MVCAAGAITEVPYPVGTVTVTECGSIRLVTGRLDIGHPMAPPVIREVLAEGGGAGLTLIDAPPGTSCSFVTTVKGSDYTVLVTEPTPFGLHDLTLAVGALRKTRVPFGVIVNRMEEAENVVTKYCAEESITVLLQIPESRRIAEFYSQGKTLLDAEPSMGENLRSVIRMAHAESWKDL